jgi:serine/threonine protein phosphatase 1
MKRKIIIGDIHGCYDELLELLNQISPAEDDLLISVGDIVDRGPKSLPVFDFFQNRENAIVVMGNHERKHICGSLSLAQRITQYQSGKDYTRMKTGMKDFAYYFEDEDIIIVHAAMLPGVPLPEQKEEILCGTMSGMRQLEHLLNGKKWYEAYDSPKPVIFGHKVMGKRPFAHRNSIFGIDTGACHGGWLTAIIVPGFKIYSVKARENYWSRIKHEGRDQLYTVGI